MHINQNTKTWINFWGKIKKMKKQFDEYNTFFDIGIEQIEKREFVTLCCTISNVIKKRSYRNRAILKYLKNKQLTEEEKNYVMMY